MCAHSAESDGLDVRIDFLDEALALEDTIVRVIGVNGHTSLMSHPLETLFGHDGIGGIECDLRLHMDQAGCGIAEDHGSTELSINGFAASGVEETTTNAGF